MTRRSQVQDRTARTSNRVYSSALVKLVSLSDARGVIRTGSLAGVAPRISVFTLFPALIETHANTSVLGRAREQGTIEIAAHDLRSHGIGAHQAVDDAPFGGGAGMVLAPEPIFASIESRLDIGAAHRPIIAMGPSGRTFTQAIAQELVELLTTSGGFSLLCGRYEGFDQRIHDHLVNDELSLGDFVLGGGEVAAMAIIEAVARLLPGVMGNMESATEESFSSGLLEYPQYTRPAMFRGWEVPVVLTSGDHGRTARWRHVQALAHTANRRPDLWAARNGATAEEAKWLKEFGVSIEGVEWPADRVKKRKKPTGSVGEAGAGSSKADRSSQGSQTD
jgi:tRNA (guanine37-N1)-methyltransferase